MPVHSLWGPVSYRHRSDRRRDRYDGRQKVLSLHDDMRARGLPGWLWDEDLTNSCRRTLRADDDGRPLRTEPSRGSVLDATLRLYAKLKVHPLVHDYGFLTQLADRPPTADPLAIRRLKVELLIDHAMLRFRYGVVLQSPNGMPVLSTNLTHSRCRLDQH